MALLCILAPTYSFPTTHSGPDFNSSANSDGVSVVRRRSGSDGMYGAYCQNDNSCSPSYKIKAFDMFKLDNIIQAIPISNTLTTKCKIIDCVGYLCAFPTISNVGWKQVQHASHIVVEVCGVFGGFSDGNGCGMGAFNEGKQLDGGLRYAYVPAPENRPGGNPGAMWKC